MKHFATLILFLPTFFSSLSQQTVPDNLSVTGIPAFPRELIERTNQFLNVRSAALADWDRAGTGMYITTRFANTAQIHLVASPGAARRQITFFDEPVTGAACDPRPGKNGFLFMKDVGGGEFYQIFYFDGMTGMSRLLTDGKSRHESMRWSHAGSLVACSSTKRNKKDTDIWIMNPDEPDKAWALTEEEGSWGIAAWAPDDRRLIISRFVSANESHPYIADIQTKKLITLEKNAGSIASYGNFEWSSDGMTIYYTSDEGGEFAALYSYDVASGKRVNLTPHLIWDVEDIALSDDGRHVAYTVNQDGIGVLHLVTAENFRELPLPAIPIGIISGLRFDQAGGRLGFTLNASTSPGDVFSVDMNTLALSRWTSSEVGGLNAEIFVAPKLIRYPTFDRADAAQRTIPAFYYRPKVLLGKAPVIIDIHGGPEGQARPGFSPNYQFWLNELGCVVLSPNVRGSTGYGKSSLALDNGFNREHSVKDIGALLDWIERQPELDARRVAVYGGSYGGYMVLAALTSYPGRIKCGVDVVGISNFVTFLQNTESYRRDLRRAEYGDERDPKMKNFLTKISPANKAQNIRGALFVAQGENDPRVPAGEARQIVSAVQKNGIPVWTMFAKDEGHGFQKKNNRDFFMRATVLFLQEFLLK